MTDSAFIPGSPFPRIVTGTGVRDPGMVAFWRVREGCGRRERTGSRWWPGPATFQTPGQAHPQVQELSVTLTAGFGCLAAMRILIANMITNSAHTSKTAAVVNELAIAWVMISCARATGLAPGSGC